MPTGCTDPAKPYISTYHPGEGNLCRLTVQATLLCRYLVATKVTAEMEMEMGRVGRRWTRPDGLLFDY